MFLVKFRMFFFVCLRFFIVCFQLRNPLILIVRNMLPQITSSTKDQWKLLLEQNAIGYVFPDENHKSNDSSTHSNTQSTDSLTAKQKTPDHGWQIIVPVPIRPTGEPSDDAAVDSEKCETERTVQPSVDSGSDDMTAIPSTSGILPAAARRLISLKDLGARKIGALKMKLIENNAKVNERGKCNLFLGFSFRSDELMLT